MSEKIIGKVHSIQSLAASDGPGVRFAVFLQGCNLRCGCCHNPDTWNISGGTEYTPMEIVEKAIHYKEYFGHDGGITISGGEPLLQPDFVREVFALCHKEGINTCLDTSGSVFGESVKAALAEADRVLLDIKYTTDELYKEHVGCDLEKPLKFLDYLEEQGIPVTVRQVIIPTLNDNEENILKLKSICGAHKCVDKIELLPFRKMCKVKYENLGMHFAHGHLPEPTAEIMKKFRDIIN